VLGKTTTQVVFMSGHSCLYRRPSGIYAVRIVVPKRLREFVGRGEIHTSTRLRDWNAAKLAALRIQLHWREQLMTLDLEKLSAGSPLLLGEGLIPIEVAAMAGGLTVGSLLGEMRNARTPIYVQAQAWQGWQVPELAAIECDYDGSGFVLNDVEAQGHKHTFTGTARVYDSAATIANLIAHGKTSEDTFRLSGDAGFFCEDMQTITVAACFAMKNAVERIRIGLAGLSRPIAPVVVASPVAAVATPLAGSVIVHDPITAKYGDMPFSKLFSILESDRPWGKENRDRKTKEARLFAELMNDPPLGKIDKEMILEYAQLLAKMPSNVYHPRRNIKIDSFRDLLAIAERDDLPRKEPSTIKGHIGRLSEILNYGVNNHMLRFNPAADYKRGRGKNSIERAQDQRDMFDQEELKLIFSQEWFSKGAGSFFKSGWTTWRPHYYWLPLLGVCTGGRLNELSQLYLDDIKQSERENDEGGSDSIWYLDFNLNQPDKTELDEPDVSNDKSLKNVNAIRVVPLHNTLVELGFPEYVAALRKAGHSRLFPELKRDSIKGYGKPAGSWFNERFLGHKLGMKRNGKKTFHSLRHCFITAIERLDASERVIAQLAGHERGKTQSGTRYVKDRSAKELKPLIERLAFPYLSDVAPFNVKAALKALKCSDKHKDCVARGKLLSVK
jgi:integrase